MERIVIIGAGAMGCLFAAKLALAGKDVTVVDVDKERVGAIARDGIIFKDDSGERQVRVSACTADTVTGPADLILLFTKAIHSAAAIRSVAHIVDDTCCALTLQNGLGNAEAIAELFPTERILLGVTDWPADFTPPNRVVNHGVGQVWLGANDPVGIPKAMAAVSYLIAAGLNAQFDSEVHAAIWEKAAFNGALNALSTILCQPVGALDCPEGRRIAEAVIDETIRVAATRGVIMNRQRVMAKTDFALLHHRGHLPSMLQDRMAGRPTEIEAINGQIVAAAVSAGIATPVTATLAELVRMITRPPQAVGT